MPSGSADRERVGAEVHGGAQTVQVVVLTGVM